MTTLDLSRSAEETYSLIEPFLKEIGVSRIADITGLDNIGIPVFASIRSDSKSLSVDSGKGTTKAQARCSAAMESIERWALDEVHLEWTRTQTKPSETSFQLNRGAQLTPLSFQTMKWTEANDHLTGETVQVPYYAVKLYDSSESLVERCWYSSTNGMAAGNTREEAIRGGLYEVIERDGVHLAMTGSLLGQRPMKKLDLQTVKFPICNDLVDQIHSAGAQIFAYDCHTEISVPTFLAVITDSEKGIGIWRGAGTHHNREVALCRAICEAVQARGIVMAGARDDITVTRFAALLNDSASVHWAKVMDDDKPSVVWDDIKSIDEALVVPSLYENGFRVLTVDFPLPIDVAAVKVLVPGLASYWTHYIEPGRPK